MTLMTVMVMILVKWWCEGFSPWEILGNIALVPSPSHQARPHFADDQDDQWSSCWKRWNGKPESQADVQNSSTTSSCRPNHAMNSLSSDICWTLFPAFIYWFCLLLTISFIFYSFSVVQILQSPLLQVKLINIGVNLLPYLWVSSNDFSCFINLLHSYSLCAGSINISYFRPPKERETSQIILFHLTPWPFLLHQHDLQIIDSCKRTEFLSKPEIDIEDA